MSEFPVSAKVEAKVGERSVDKLIDAVVDAFSPATEFLGALGDSVRLARVSQAATITRKAKQIADENSLDLVAPPLKFLVPFYEKASLESDDVDLTEMWASLLASAATNEAYVRPLYIDTLAKMSGGTARGFGRISGKLNISSVRAPQAQMDGLVRATNLVFGNLGGAGEVLSSPGIIDAFESAGALPTMLCSYELNSPQVSSQLLDQMKRRALSSGKLGATYKRPTPGMEKKSYIRSGAFEWSFVVPGNRNELMAELVMLGLFKEFDAHKDHLGDPTGQVSRSVISGFSMTVYGAGFLAAVQADL